MKKEQLSPEELLEACRESYGAKSYRELAGMLGIPATTLHGMKENLSSVGRLLLETLIENQKLRRSQKVLDEFAEILLERLEHTQERR